ncbi:SMI1/KNR4 family protein [Anabaena sp. CCY 9910]|uniref:SMI1/KNR4 family protein n=1 Tax=Anabaena sp. CCY 9910 TaxID=3103870 RepID=UPI0039DFD481
MNIGSSGEQQLSHTEKVIVICPNCSQKLRTPIDRGELRLACPKCKHNWQWSPGTNITIQIERIKEKLEKARQLQSVQNQLYQEFYPSTDPLNYSFKFNPPLSSHKIDAWETKYNTCLPVEYRSFLEQIGNGGGDVHGMEMLRLEDWAVGLCFGDEDKALIAPSQPCLLLEEYQSDEAWERWLVEIAGEHWEQKYEQELWSPQFGTITVSKDECGPFGFMVLNGSLKGRIGWFLGDWGPPTFESSATFLDWYELWLDGLIAI